MKTYTQALLIFILIVITNQISFSLKPRSQTCLKINGNHSYEITYVSSGEDDKNVKMELFNNGKLL